MKKNLYLLLFFGVMSASLSADTPPALNIEQLKYMIINGMVNVFETSRAHGIAHTTKQLRQYRQGLRAAVKSALEKANNEYRPILRTARLVKKRAHKMLKESKTSRELAQNAALFGQNNKDGLGVLGKYFKSDMKLLEQKTEKKIKALEEREAAAAKATVSTEAKNRKINPQHVGAQEALKEQTRQELELQTMALQMQKAAA